MKTLYDELIENEVPLSSWASDLYFPVNEQTTKILLKYQAEYNIAKKFTVQIGHQNAGQLWYEVPFAYIPYWERRL